MKIGILSRNPELYSTRRLQQAAKEHGCKIAIIDYSRCYLNITSNEPKVLFGGKEVEVDCIIPRIGASTTFYGAAVVRQFELVGIPTVNTAAAISNSRDKLKALQALSVSGVGIPTTSFARSPKDISGLIDEAGGPPVVVKLLEATQGAGVVLAETRKAAEAVISGFKQLNANILVQEFIKESGGSDVRVLVVNDKIVAAMKRQSPPDDFRSNLHRGGKSEQVELTHDEQQAALKAARALGLGVAGVDILRSYRGPLVLEVNSSPGLQGIEKISRVDVAGDIIGYAKQLIAER